MSTTRRIVTALGKRVRTSLKGTGVKVYTAEPKRTTQLPSVVVTRKPKVH